MSDPENLAGQRLLRTIDTIDADIALIELWACALNGFAQPAPDYDLGRRHRRDAKQDASAEAA